MKKILFIFPVVFFSLFSCCFSLFSFAKYDNKYTVTENGIEYVRNHDFEPVDNEYYYISFNCPDYYSPGNNGAFFGMRIEDTTAVESLVISEEEGVITFDFSAWKNNPGLPSFYVYFLGSSSDRHNDVQYVVYDSNSSAESVSIIFNGGYTRTITAAEHGLCHFETNLLSPDVMDVEVTFKPSLNGPVDRSGVDSEGNEYLTQYLSMRVDNNSKFPIQYRMAIYELFDAESSDYTERPNTYDSSASHEQYSTRYDNDPVFVYYSNDWVYTDVPLAADSHNDLQNLYLKPTDLHYVAAGDSDSVTFSWSQINLHEGVNYRVVVTAVRNDYDHASMNYSDIFEEDVDSGVYQIDSSLSDKVYESLFVMLQYNDVKYDYSNSSNGILPYNGANGIDDAKRYQYSYDAVTDPRSGATDYKSVNLYDDSNSWINQPFSHGSSSYLDTDSSNGKYNSLVAETSSVLKFFNAVFGFLPSEISSIYALGFWSLVILAIVRRIH